MATKKTKVNNTDKNAAINEIFGAAAVVAPPEKKTKKSKKAKYEMPDPYETFIALKIVAEMLTKPAEALREELVDKVLPVIDEELLLATGQVETFAGFRGDAEGNIQVKKCAHIPPAIVELMKENEISYEEEEVTPGNYIINPEILNNQELLGKLAVALKNAPGLEGVEIIQRQLAKTKPKLTEQTFRDLAEVEDQTLRRTILSGITSPAFSHPKMDEDKALKVVKKLGLI